MTRVIEIQTPGRIHFGLSSFGGTARQFSGLGLMVEGVGVTLRVSPAAAFRVSGIHRQRGEAFAHRWASHQRPGALPASELEVVSAPPDHVGLGVGTQLGLAVAAGLSELCGIEWRDAALLSQMSGRGRRSAIGTHGFLQGGLLVDAGKLPNETLGRLDFRAEIPSEWRFVLIRQPAIHGLAGSKETKAMGSLSPVPAEVTSLLQELIEEQILPAVKAADWRAFSAGLFEYGHRAGECFSAVQGGPFASPSIAALVDHVREIGFPGVGQSSWGPTVFVVSPDQQAADELVGKLQQHRDFGECHFVVTQANNSGATVEDIALGHSHGK